MRDALIQWTLRVYLGTIITQIVFAQPQTKDAPSLVVQLGHSREIEKMAVSPDGKCLATGADGCVILWSADSLRELRRFKDPLGRDFLVQTIKDVRFSPDSRYIAVEFTGFLREFNAGSDSEFYVWEVETGRFINFNRHITLFAFLNNGQALCGFNEFLSEFSEGSNLTLVDLANVQEPKVILEGIGQIADIATSRSGTFFAVGSTDGTVWVDSLPDGKIMGELKTDGPSSKGWKAGAVSAIAVASDESVILVGNLAGSVGAFDVKTKRNLWINNLTEQVLDIAFTSGGKHVVVTGSLNCYLLDLEGSEAARFPRSSKLKGARFTPDGHNFIVAGQGQVTLRNISTGQVVRRYTGPQSEISEFGLSSDGHLLTATTTNGRIWIWKVESENPIALHVMDTKSKKLITKQPEFISNEIYDRIVSLSRDGRYLLDLPVPQSQSEEMQIYDLSNLKSPSHITINSVDSRDVYDGVFSCAYHLVYGEGGKTLDTWDAAGRTPISRFDLDNDVEILQAELSPNMALGAVATGRTIKIWSSANGQKCSELQESRNASWMCFSQDGSKIAACREGGHIGVWDSRSGKLILQIKDANNHVDIDIAPDGRRVLTTSIDGTVSLWDVRSGANVKRFPIMPKAAQFVDVQADGTTAVIHETGTLELRKVSSKETVPVYKADENEQQTAAVYDPNTGNAFFANGNSVNVSTGNLKEFVATLGFSDYVNTLSLIRPPSKQPNLSEAFPKVAAVTVRSENHSESHLLTTAHIGGNVFSWNKNGPSCRKIGQELSKMTMPVMLSPDESRVGLITDFLDGVVTIHDVLKGVELFKLPSTDFGAVLFTDRFMSGYSPDSRVIAWRQYFNSTELQLIDAKDGSVKCTLPHQAPVTLTSFSSDSRQVVTCCDGDFNAYVWSVSDGKLTRVLNGHHGQILFVERLDANQFVTGASDGTVRIWNIRTGQEVNRLSIAPEVIQDVVQRRHIAEDATIGFDHIKIGPLQDILLVAKFTWHETFGDMNYYYPILWNPVKGLVLPLEIQDDTANDANGHSTSFSPDGDVVIWNHTVWETNTGKKRYSLGDLDKLASAPGFTSDGKFISICNVDRIKYYSTINGAEVCDLFGFQSRNWAVVCPDGRFDYSDIAVIKDMNWVFPDDPFEALAPEIFMRDYFEPRLLSRLMSGEKLPPVRALNALNRVQPLVSIEPRVDQLGELDIGVTVIVSSQSGQFGKDALKQAVQSGVFDLRLFRDGQLVGQWPEPAVGQDSEFEPDPTSEADMRKWRDMNRVVVDNTRVTTLPDGKMSIEFPVRLPHRDVVGAVEFTVYAFNEDRVKSETARFAYEAPAKPLKPLKPRAYLIGMGVSTSQNPSWNLKFAANDARLTVEELSKSLPQYDVVPILLTSEPGMASPPATRENLRTVLQLLGGNKVPVNNKAAIPNADQLQLATPDDLVLIAFSGHGYTDLRGILHLLPYDVGANWARFEEVLPHCISSGDLAAWMKDIDAGELVLILDACHSAAAGAPPGFKPGPLGGRGLAQLAYDKGMRVLAASQANDVALECERIQHGLLTYAMIREGLQNNQAMREDKLTMGGLMAYAAERVPSLYEGIINGSVTDIAKRDVLPIQPKNAERSKAQTPELFDYAKKRPNVLLLK